MIRDLSMKSDNSPAPCEVRVEIQDGDDWVRIPVTSCEMWVDKDGPANIQRNAKVRFPGEWGGHDILQYINGFTVIPTEGTAEGDLAGVELPTLLFDKARIYFQDEDTGVYQIAHYGYVGGVGPAAADGVFKLYIYDPADLMRRIPVSKSFGQPTIQQVINFVLRGEDDNSNEVGLEHRSPFDNVGTYIAGVQEVKQQKVLEERQEEEVFELAEDGFSFLIGNTLPFVGAYQIDATNVVADIFDWAKDNLIDPLLTGQKRFQLNRHNLVDLLDWFAAEIGGKWHFEPTEDGPILFFDNSRSRGAETTLFGARQRADGELTRRRFVDKELGIRDRAAEFGAAGDISDFTDRDAFDSITTLDNRALYDIKPFNSLTLYGETHDPTEYSALAAGPDPVASSNAAPPSAPIMSSRFPRVTVTYEPLLERAGGYIYEAPPIESDKVSLSQAKREAVKEFRSYLEEETEGKIEIRGNPYIIPYDYITTIPVCEGTFPNVNAPSMTYEVNSVKHTRAAGEHYTCELGVSLVFDETKLDIEAEYVDA